ncbi:MAG: hypothetical protein ACOX7K_07815 [Oscillospiraceae bacterium]|jgi:hypothetical protein
MKDFIMAALPWVTVGISVAILATNAAGKKIKSSYVIEGMLIGMGIGYAVCALLEMSHNFGIGMLIGEAIGSFIEKKGEKSNDGKCD